MTDDDRTPAEPTTPGWAGSEPAAPGSTGAGPAADPSGSSPADPGPRDEGPTGAVSPVPTWFADQPLDQRPGVAGADRTAVLDRFDPYRPQPSYGQGHPQGYRAEDQVGYEGEDQAPYRPGHQGGHQPQHQQGHQAEYWPGAQPAPQQPWSQPAQQVPWDTVGRTGGGDGGWDGTGWQGGTSGSGQGAVDTLGRAPRRRRGGRGLVVLAVVLALLAGLVGGAAGSVLAARSGLLALPGGGGGAGDGSASGASGETSAGQVDPLPTGETGTVAEIAARVLPSVVSIRVRAGAGEGTGSGFVIDADGLILTNNHVIAAGGTTPAEDIVVELGDGSQAEAEVVGTEPSYDIAVLRIDPDDVGTPLVSLPYGDSDRVVVGEQVVAVGAPLGLDSTVTTGIVSALNRPVSAGDAQQTAFINAIQTDAAINPGNSGGPLVNMRGEVVGVNSAIAQAPGGQVGGSIGLGFSIPSNQAERTAGQLVTDGVATFPVVGVLLDRSYTGEGVRIVSEEDATDAAPVTPGGPAAEAGLRAGDVILAFEGRPMTESDELVVAIRAREPGDEVTLTVRRGEEVFDVMLVLQEGERP